MPSTIYSYYMSGIIQSLPSPSAYSGGITHTWLGESWMVDVDALVMMMAMISSFFPSRQGARTEFLVPGIGFLVVAAQRTCFAKSSEHPLAISRHVGHIGERGGQEDAGGSQTPPRRGKAWAHAWLLSGP